MACTISRFCSPFRLLERQSMVSLARTRLARRARRAVRRRRRMV
jgi:hypothetical protein